MATRARREEEARRRRAAGLDYSDAAITAAVGALDTTSYSSSYDSGSSCTDTSSSFSSGCD